MLFSASLAKTHLWHSRAGCRKSACLCVHQESSSTSLKVVKQPLLFWVQFFHLLNSSDFLFTCWYDCLCAEEAAKIPFLLLKENLPSPKSFVLLKTLEAALGWWKSATMLTCTSQGLSFPSVILCQSVDLQRIFSLENFSTSTFLHRVKLGKDASLLI